MKNLLLTFLLLNTVTFLFAQTKTLTGRVTNNRTTLPLPDVSVVVKGTGQGVTTDADGKFSINVPVSAKSLSLSSVGFNPQVITIGDKSDFEITLTPEDSKLEEVVVVGYGTQKRRDVTAAVSVIGGDKVKDAPVQSFDQALGGKAAGLNITQPNGVLNNPPVIRIRGAGSITGSSYPLIVVDGVAIFTGDVSTNNSVNNPLGDINPADIDEITVLKDAAATAIYGSRAAPGVLVITTKKERAQSHG